MDLKDVKSWQIAFFGTLPWIIYSISTFPSLWTLLLGAITGILITPCFLLSKPAYRQQLVGARLCVVFGLAFFLRSFTLSNDTFFYYMSMISGTIFLMAGMQAYPEKPPTNNTTTAATKIKNWYVSYVISFIIFFIGLQTVYADLSWGTRYQGHNEMAGMSILFGSVFLIVALIGFAISTHLLNKDIS